MISYLLLDIALILVLAAFFFEDVAVQGGFRGGVYRNRFAILAMFGVLNLVSFMVGGLYQEGVYAYLFALTFMVVALVDIREGMISDNLNIFLFISSFFYLYSLGSQEALLWNLIYAFGVIGFFTFVRFLSSAIYAEEKMGEGDFLPLSVFVMAFGLEYGVFLIFLSLLLTVPYFFSRSLLKGGFGGGVPFVPFLFIGLILGFVFETDFQEILKTSMLTLF